MKTRERGLAARLWPWAKFAILLAAIVWLVQRGASAMGYNWQWYRVPSYFWTERDGVAHAGPLIDGLRLTIEIAAASLPLALLIGLLAALARTSPSKVASGLGSAYVTVVRNTPILVQLYLVYFLIAPVLGLGRWQAGVLCLALFEGAYAAEIFRAGVAAVPKGQSEAAKSLGLSAFRVQTDIVLPQALRIMLPALVNLAVALIKHSAILSVIAIQELTTKARDIISDTYMAFEIWLTAAALYIVLTASTAGLAGAIERRFSRERLARGV